MVLGDLARKVGSYDAPSTEEIARRTGIPVSEIVRFDGNTSPHPLPSTRAEVLEEELARKAAAAEDPDLDDVHLAADELRQVTVVQVEVVAVLPDPGTLLVGIEVVLERVRL